MSREYIISVPNDAGFVEYSYISGGRKYQTHYAYRKMEHLVRCKDCKHGGRRNDADIECRKHKLIMRLNDFCSYGCREERSGECLKDT